MKKIAVIGSGTMGNGIAHAFIQKGFPVSLMDVSSDALRKALDTIGMNMDRMIKNQSLTAEEKNSSLKLLTTSTSMEECVSGCGLVIEAATENIDLKLKIFRELDALCANDTILASNTSSLSITK